jgi:hypothetical protein
MVLVFTLFAFLLTFLLTRDFRNAIIIAALIICHWILDFITWPMFGRGLPLLFHGSHEVGLGLYSTTVGSIIGEIGGLSLTVMMIIILIKDRKRSKALSARSRV